jgi:MoaA/NifB/PqqE/SkfB family radical SAM enzyme
MSKSNDYSLLLDEYHRREVNVKTRPAVIFLDTMDGCPFNCIMCKPKPTKIQRMSPDILSKVEPYFASAEVVLANGSSEPLVDNQEYWVRQSVENDFVLHMNTNGFLLKEEMAEQLVKTRLSIRFSFHAGRPDTYYRIMGVEMERSVNNIKRLVEKSNKSSKPHDFWFSYCVMKENVHEIEDFLRLAHDCGIHSVRFMRLLRTPRILLGIKLRGMTFRYFEQTGKQVDRIFFANLPRYKELATELSIKLEWGDKVTENPNFAKSIGGLINMATNRTINRTYFPLIPPKSAHCAAPWIGQLGIDMWGGVTLCCETKYRIGDLNESSLDEIWNGPKMTEIRQAFHDGRYPRLCGYCRGFGFDDYPNNSFPGIRQKETILPSIGARA